MSTYDLTQAQLSATLAATVTPTTSQVVQSVLEAVGLTQISGPLAVETGYDPSSNGVTLAETTKIYLNTLTLPTVESIYTVGGQVLLTGDATVTMIDETGGKSAGLVDTMVGGAGNAKIVAVSGYNDLIAGKGPNTLHGGTGFDSLYGGGFTHLVAGSGSDSLYGIGFDTLNAGSGASPGNITYMESGSTFGQGVEMFGGTTPGSVTIMDGEYASGNDLMKSNGGNDSIWGGAGADTIKAGTGDDHIWNGTGAETIYGAGPGGLDKTMLTKGGPTDFIGGQGGVDHLNVGDFGNDTITGGGAQNTKVFVYNTTAHTENSVTIGGTSYQNITFANGQTLTVKGVSINFLSDGTHQIIT